MKIFQTFLLSFLLLNFSELSAQKFVNQTDDAGLSGAVSTAGVAVADYDQDGDLDIYFVAINQYDENDSSTWNRLYQNSGDGKFIDVTLAAGVMSYLQGGPWEGEMGNKSGVSWGDVDNDGYPDLYLTNVGPNELFHNLGDGTFENITTQAGVVGDSVEHHAGATWWDYDNDSDLDLYICNWSRNGANFMYENQFAQTGEIKFLDVSQKSNLDDLEQSWTALPFDGNNDDLIDLYVVNDFGPSHFFINLGDKTFREATAEFGLVDEGNSMGIAVGDYDNNGLFDIYTTNIEGLNPPTPNQLFTNTGSGFFLNKSVQLDVDATGWAWGTEFFDYDNDGDEDLYIVNGFLIEPGYNYFYANTLSQFGVPNFVDRSVESATNGYAEARSLVVFDWNDDGDLDLLVSNFREKNYLYENQSTTLNWLKIELQGTISNRNAVGAIVRVSTNNGLTYHRHNNGVDFLAQSILPIHFGVGTATSVDEIIVEWPGGLVESFTDYDVNQTIKLIEGTATLSAVDTQFNAQDGSRLALLGAFPNPFSKTVTVRFIAPAGPTSFSIRNLAGELVRQLKFDAVAGENAIIWNGKSDSGGVVSTGLYFYTLITDGGVKSGKLLLVR